MLARRLFAITMTGIITVTSAFVSSVTSYATEDGGIVFFSDSEGFEETPVDNSYYEETTSDTTSEVNEIQEEYQENQSQNEVVRETTYEAETETETETKPEAARSLSGEEDPESVIEPEEELNPDELEQKEIDPEEINPEESEEILTEEEYSDAIFSVRFYPNGGQLISEFTLSEDVNSWEYDVTDGVMTVYAQSAKNALMGFGYALEMTDGSRTFDGWYYDESMSEKADFGEGIPLKRDISLYAGFSDSASPYVYEEISIVDSLIEQEFEGLAEVKEIAQLNEIEDEELLDSEIPSEIELPPDDEEVPAEDDSIYAVRFNPGEGQIISEFEVGEDVSSWDYDAAERVMTLYVQGARDVIKGVNYALAVPDGSKNFDGWYYDEALTQKADLQAGIAFAGDTTLYAGFSDNNNAPNIFEQLISKITGTAEKEPVAEVSLNVPTDEVIPEDSAEEALEARKEMTSSDLILPEDEVKVAATVEPKEEKAEEKVEGQTEESKEVQSDEKADGQKEEAKEEKAVDKATEQTEDKSAENKEEQVAEEKTGELKEEQTTGNKEDQEEPADTILTIKFYPGEGTLISEFKIGDNVSDWEYDPASGIMTMHVSASSDVIKGIDYTLETANGSKSFEGWYYDEALTKEADLEAGITVDKDISLYAAFGDGKDSKSGTEQQDSEEISIAVADSGDVQSDKKDSNANDAQSGAESGDTLTSDGSEAVAAREELASEDGTKSDSEEAQDNVLHIISFYPGEGTLISEFKTGDNVSDWEYDPASGIMTMHVSASSDVIKGIDYTLETANGSKSFEGWYYDEALTKEADLEAGITVDKDISLYAAFGDGKTSKSETEQQGSEEMSAAVPESGGEPNIVQGGSESEDTLASDEAEAIAAREELASDGEESDSIETRDDVLHTVRFYPGEGTLISEFKITDQVVDWEYEPSTKLMTMYVPSSTKVLKGIDYSLDVANGQKEFEGWFYDETMTQEADLEEGISLEEDISLYAGFSDGEGSGTENSGTDDPDTEGINADLTSSLDLLTEMELSPDGTDLGEYDIDVISGEEIISSAYENIPEVVTDPVYEEKEVTPQYDIDERDEALFAGIDIANSNLKISEITSKDYTGDAVTFDEDEIRVYFNGIRLKEGDDYKLTYSNNTNAFKAPEYFIGLTDSEKAALKPPTVKVSLTGKYTGNAELYFDIKGMDISEAYLASSGVMTARYLDKAFDQYPVVKAELPNGKTVSLTIGEDYDVFYNRIINIDGAEAIDYSEMLSAAQVADVVRKATESGSGEDIFFLVNMRGKRNFAGVLASEEGINWAPRLQVMSKASVEASFLQLDNANLSKKVPVQEYREDNTGMPISASADVIKLFKDGEIEVSIAGQKLTYVEDEAAASTISSEGYYFRAVDPATSDNELNRRIGTNNYITLVATDIPEYNRIAGSFNVFFEIKGTKLNIKSIRPSLDYDGKTVLVYGEDDADGDGYLDVDIKASITRIDAVVTDSNDKVLSTDRYTVSTDYDTADAGRVIVTFEGKAERGVTGSVSKKIKIEKRKLTEDDVKVNFADKNMSPDGVPLSGGMAEPAIIVRLLDTGAVLKENKDYTVVYSDNTDVGQIGSITVKFVGNYSGKLDKVLYFRVAKMLLSYENIEVFAEDKVYKENAGSNYFKSKPILSNEGNDLKLKTDYVYAAAPTYYYAENLTEKNAAGKIIYSRKAGTPIDDDEVVHAGALIEVRFSIIPSSKTENYTAEKDSKGNYIPVEFSTTYRMGKMSIESAKVKIEDQEYDNGYSVIPGKDDITVTIGSGDNAVTLGRNDYLIIDAVSCEDVGTATLVIQGRGRYVGTKEVTYKIVKGRGEIN